MSALRIGVDAANLLIDRRGIGRYARALLRRFTAAPGPVEVVLLVPHVFRTLVLRRFVDEIGSENFTIEHRGSAGRARLDLVWYPWNGMTWIAPGKKVATVHDVWPFASPAPNPRVRRNEQTPFRATVAHADRIIADSRFTRSQIVAQLGGDESRIDVVPLGVDPPVETTPEDRALPEGVGRYVLFVGEAEPRKDLPTLLAAVERIGEPLRHELTLVLAGRRAHWRNFGRSETVRTLMVGEITEKRLAALYRGAAVFVFPSTYEGFGLPVLEAMSYGAPVVASDAASIPEAGGDAALYFPAGNGDALAAQLERVLNDPTLALRLGEAGKRRAAEMTWDRCAESTLAVLDRAAADK